jgi:catechol 2,3-dioxygenase-like lactoylglutathione lyase family enzyme
MTVTTPPYHLAMVVEDLEKAKAELGAALGLTFVKPQRRQVQMEAPGGPISFEVCYVYSCQGPPYIELIEQRAGTIFERLGLHHVGIWSDDRVAESKRLDGQGWPRETVGLRPDGSWAGGLYHRGTGDLRIEVVDIRSSGPKLLRYLAGGDYS